MKRREFLTAAASSLLLPVIVDGMGVKSYKQNSGLIQSLLQTSAVNNDRVLVIIYLGGGNDGLNTVIPLEHYSAYNGLRSNIAIPENKVLALSGSPETGLHPAMTGLRDLYNEGKLTIVHSVSYPNPDLSHIRSTEIWMSGIESNQDSTSGWAGRYLDDRFPGYPQNYPSSEIDDPLALQIGPISTKTLLGNRQGMQITLNDPVSFYQMIGSQKPSFTDLPAGDGGDLIGFVREQQLLSVGYASQIKAASESGANMAAFPVGNPLAEQLKIVSRLIHGGLSTKIYYVELGGFDTHSTQVGTTSVEGIHATLLKQLSDGISAFQKDLQLQGNEDKVIGMTFSDFGRRATSNASKGTDHGVAAPMFVFGKGVKRQVVGTNPDLVNGLLPIAPASWDTSRDIKMQIDFRRVYGDILNDWFGTVPSKTNELLFKNFPTTSLFSDTVQTLSSGAWPNPAIWSNGRVPSSKEFVKINAGHIVEVGQNITARSVQVNGELKFLGDYNVNITG